MITLFSWVVRQVDDPAWVQGWIRLRAVWGEAIKEEQLTRLQDHLMPDEFLFECFVQAVVGLA